MNSPPVSNCCSASPTCQEDLEIDRCPKCHELCVWVKDDDGYGEYIYECKRDNDKLNEG